MGKALMKKKAADIFISLLGIILIAWSLGMPLLGLVGERAAAQITYIRKQGGQRNESVSNRYTYVVSYRFKLPDGSPKDGFTYRIGNYSKVYGLPAGNSITVRYLKSFPGVNAPEGDASFSPEKLIVLAVGYFLAVGKNLKGKSAKKRRKKSDSTHPEVK